jgi:hypothetical protein
MSTVAAPGPVASPGAAAAAKVSGATLAAAEPAHCDNCGAAVTFYIAWYAYRSLRVVYGQRRLLTLGKLVSLSFFYLVSGSLMLGLVTVYSVFTL